MAKTNPLSKLGGAVKGPAELMPPPKPEPVADAPAAAAVSGTSREVHYQYSSTYPFRIRIPGKVATVYEKESAEKKVDIEDLMEERLAKFSDADADMPIVFNDDDRNRISTLLGVNVTTPAGIIYKVEQLVTVTVGGVEIELSPIELERVSSRLIHGKTLEQQLTEWVLEKVRLEVGLQ